MASKNQLVSAIYQYLVSSGFSSTAERLKKENGGSVSTPEFALDAVFAAFLEYAFVPISNHPIRNWFRNRPPHNYIITGIRNARHLR